MQIRFGFALRRGGFAKWEGCAARLLPAKRAAGMSVDLAARNARRRLSKWERNRGVTKAAEVRGFQKRPPSEGTRASFRNVGSRPLVGGRCGFCCLCRFPRKAKRRMAGIVQIRFGFALRRGGFAKWEGCAARLLPAKRAAGMSVDLAARNARRRLSKWERNRGVTKAAEVRGFQKRPPSEGTRASFRNVGSRPLVGGRCGFCCLCRFPCKAKRRRAGIVRQLTRRGALRRPAVPQTVLPSMWARVSRQVG